MSAAGVNKAYVYRGYDRSPSNVLLIQPIYSWKAPPKKSRALSALSSLWNRTKEQVTAVASKIKPVSKPVLTRCAAYGVAFALVTTSLLGSFNAKPARSFISNLFSVSNVAAAETERYTVSDPVTGDVTEHEVSPDDIDAQGFEVDNPVSKPKVVITNYQQRENADPKSSKESKESKKELTPAQLVEKAFYSHKCGEETVPVHYFGELPEEVQRMLLEAAQKKSLKAVMEASQQAAEILASKARQFGPEYMRIALRLFRLAGERKEEIQKRKEIMAAKKLAQKPEKERDQKPEKRKRKAQTLSQAAASSGDQEEAKAAPEKEAQAVAPSASVATGKIFVMPDVYASLPENLKQRIDSAAKTGGVRRQAVVESDIGNFFGNVKRDWEKAETFACRGASRMEEAGLLDTKLGHLLNGNCAYSRLLNRGISPAYYQALKTPKDSLFCKPFLARVMKTKTYRLMFGLRR